MHGYVVGRAFRRMKTDETPKLEILDHFTSGRVYYRYGTGGTILTGYCQQANYPAEALETVASFRNLKEQQRHQDAADDLVDMFFQTHGVFRLGK